MPVLEKYRNTVNQSASSAVSIWLPELASAIHKAAEANTTTRRIKIGMARAQGFFNLLWLSYDGGEQWRISAFLS